jgi:hypothetical protein
MILGAEGRPAYADSMIGELRGLHRHLWIAWILVVAIAVVFIVFIQP